MGGDLGGAPGLRQVESTPNTIVGQQLGPGSRVLVEQHNVCQFFSLCNWKTDRILRQQAHRTETGILCHIFLSMWLFLFSDYLQFHYRLVFLYRNIKHHHPKGYVSTYCDWQLLLVQMVNTYQCTKLKLTAQQVRTNTLCNSSVNTYQYTTS